MYQVSLIIDDKLYFPVVQGGLLWSTERKSTPGSIKLSILRDDSMKIEEGCPIALVEDKLGVFHGFIFTIKESKDDLLEIIAYDQLRYLKNRDTYVYSNWSTGDLLKCIASDFRLKTGFVDNTGIKLKIAEVDTELFDMLNNSIADTADITKVLYILYDDYGELCLRKSTDLILNVVIDSTSAEDYTFTRSIDESTYNSIKLAYANKKAGTREIFQVFDSNNIKKWGVLQYYEQVQNNNTAKDKVEKLLSMHNTPKRTLNLKNCFGDSRVRAGFSVLIPLFDAKGEQSFYPMMVESAKHTYNADAHFMDIKLTGGVINS